MCRTTMTVAEMRKKLDTLLDSDVLTLFGGTAGSGGLEVERVAEGFIGTLFYSSGEWGHEEDEGDLI